jgi:hypothetical protein
VRKARALEVGAHVVGQPLVLTEHHPAQQRRLRIRQPAREAALGPAAGSVDQPEEPAAARTGPPQTRHVERGQSATAALVGVVDAERLHATRDRDDLPHARARRGMDPEHRTAATRRPVEQARPADRQAPRTLAQRLEHHGVGGDQLSAQARQRPAHDRGETQVRHHRAEQQRRGGRERHAAWSGERHRQDEQRRDNGRGPRQRPEQQSGRQREQHRMPRVRVQRVQPSHTRTRSRSAASRTSPMPGTSPSSSTEPKPPCCSR